MGTSGEHTQIALSDSTKRYLQGIKAVYGGVHAMIEIPIAAFLILLSMDVRNYDKLPTSKLNGNGKQPSGRGLIGNVISTDSGMPVPIDTRTNEPVREEDRRL